MTVYLKRRATLLSLVLAAGLLWPATTAAGPAAPGGGGPAPSNTCFVITIYRDLFGRPPAAGELSSGLSFLTSNGRGVFAHQLLVSLPYQTVLIQAMYQKYLGRAASAFEVSAGLSILSGGTDEDLRAAILGSAEYFGLPRVGGDNTNFIQAVYHELLGHAASGPEVTTWLGFLAFPHTRTELADQILASLEYQAVIIQAWYHKYLGRTATGGEVSAAESQLASGTDEGVIATILGSPEYFSQAGLCAVYLPLARR